MSSRRNRVSRWVIAVLCVCTVGVRATVPESAVQCRVELDRALLPVGDRETAIVKITLDAPKPPRRTKRPRVNLSIVLDRSGSMGGKKLERAKEAAIEALRRLGSGDMFSLVIYDHQVETLVPAQNASNTEWIESRIRQIRSGGNTALFAGVSQGAAEIRKHVEGEFVHRIILLSDGLANVGPNSPSDLGRLGTGLIKEGISVTTVGVGTDYNEDLMAQLAQNSDGNTYFVENSRDLPRIFSEELGDVLSIVANKVTLQIECGAGVIPLRIVGRPGRIRGRTVELHLNQLYGGQEKFALVEVQLPATPHGKRAHIATARVSYVDPFTREAQISTAAATGTFSADRSKVERSADRAVVIPHALNVSAVAQEKAIQLADESKRDEAVAVLQAAARDLRLLGLKYNDQMLLERASQLDAQATTIRREGMSKRSRKALRSESFSIYNQQRVQ